MPSVEEKVVKLSMDESSLDKGSKKAINSLDELKQALLFKDAEKGFEAVSAAASKVDMSGLSDGVQEVATRFNILDTVAASALFNITNKAIDAGQRLVSALTIDQVNAGWDKFADKTAAVQTIMSATSNQFNDTGKQMEYVESQLEKLNWFTDETSYRFLDMVNNIGKFTSGNIALDKSVDAMQGIAVWAARSGAGVEGAGRAMYNLSQSMAMGTLRLEDWMSIENANMATYEFKKTALDTAVSVGTLTKKADGLYQTLDGTAVSIEGFRETLQEKWLTSDVLIKTLETYGRFATELNSFYEELEGNVPTTTLIGFIDDYIDGTLDMSEAMRLTGKDAEWLGERISKLASDEYKLGRESFKAAQETKTFQEAIDYVKESVSSGWMRTFEYLFGNYEEAKEFFSNMSEWLYDIFVAGGDARNALLALWKDEGGRDVFIQGLYDLMDIVSTILETISDAWHEIVPETTVDDLHRFTQGFANFVNILKPTEAQLTLISSIVRALATGFQTLKRMVSNATKVLYPFLLVLNRAAGIAANVVAAIAEFSIRLMNLIFPLNEMDQMGDSMAETAWTISSVLNVALDGLVYILDSVYSAVDTFFTYVEQNGGGVAGILTALGLAFEDLINNLFSGANIEGALGTIFGSIAAIFGSVVDTIKGFITSLTGYSFEDSTDMKGWLAGVAEMLDGADIPGKLSTIAVGIGNLIGQLLTFVAVMFNVEADIHGTITGIVDAVQKLFTWIIDELSNLKLEDVKNVALVIFLGELVWSLKDLFKSLKTSIGGLTKVFTSLQNVLKPLEGDQGITKQLESIFSKTKWLQIGLAIGILVSGLIQLASLPAEKLYQGVIAIAATLGVVLVALKLIQKMTETTKGGETIDDFVKTMTGFGIGVGLIGLAIAQMAKQDPGNLVVAMGTMVAIMSALWIFTKAMQEMDTKKIVSVAGSTALLAAGITSMVPAIAILAGLVTLSPESVAGSILAIVGLLTAFGAYGKLMSKTDWSSILAAVPLTLSLAAALAVLGTTFTALAALSSDGFKQGMLGLLGAISVLGLALGFLTEKSSMSDAGSIATLSLEIIAFAAAISILSGAMQKIGAMPIDQYTQGFSGFLGVLISFGVVSGILLAVASACAAATAPLAALAAVILSVAAVFAAFALAAVGVSTAANRLVDAFRKFIEIGKEFGDKIPDYVSKAMDGVRVAIYRLLEIVAGSYGLMILAAGAFFSAIVDALILVIPDIIEGLMVLATEVFAAIAKLADPLCQALVDMLDAITRNMGPIFAAIDRFLTSALVYLLGVIPRILVNLWDFIKNLIAGNDFEESLALVFGDTIASAVEKGTDEGLDKAQENTEKRMGEFGKATGEKYPEGVEKAIEENSPADIVNDAISEVSDSSTARQTVMANNGEGDGGAYSNALLKSIQNTLGGSLDSSGLFNMMGMSSAGVVSDSSAPDTGDPTNRYAREQAKLAAEKREALEKQGSEDGNVYADSLASSIASSKAPSSAARSQVRSIGDAFSDEIDKLNMDEKTADAIFRLWKVKNPNASESEIAIKEMELQSTKIQTQAAKAQISQQVYTETLAKMGESAKETHEAYVSMIEDQIKLIELQNEMTSMQQNQAETTAEAFQKMNDVLHDYYYTENNGRTTAEFLKSIGFTDQEITKAAAKEAGYAIPEMVDSLKEDAVTAATNAGQQTVQLYTTSVTNNLSAMTPTFQTMGNTYAQTLGTGMVEKTDDVGQAAKDTVNGAHEQASSADMMSKWEDLGYQIDMGIVQGLRNGADAVSKEIARIIRALLAAAAAAAGVASPSKETEYQATMWIAGYVRGLDRNAGKIKNVIVDDIGSSMDAFNGLNNSAKEVGEGFAKNIAAGINESSSILSASTNSLLTATEKDINKFARSDAWRKGLMDAFDVDDSVHVSVVVDLDKDSWNQVRNQMSKVSSNAATFNNDPFGQASKIAYSADEMANRIIKIEEVYRERKSTTAQTDTAAVQNFNFEQNNYSPKSLSRAEIRRDTERMASQMARELAKKNHTLR